MQHFTISQTAIEGVINDMRSGNTGHVGAFFACRPDWLDQQDETTYQADEQQQAVQPTEGEVENG